uniref:Uncharacterized protein n=1 Tax=Panagrolaimus sp. JU765 TaxID=591449 RepID=A0AC34Q524_9BILA
MPIIICQKFVGENRRILKLKRTTWLLFDIAFKVVSASNLDKNYYSGVFKAREQNFVLENVDRDEILKVKFVDKRIKRRDRGAENFPHPRYSAAMLESAFPTANFTTPDERVEKINNVLGTNIQLIQADNFAQTVEIILQDS